MIPVLYKANETDFTHLGLGVLTGTLRAEVTEERNGVFELEVDYPVDGLLFNSLKNDRLIKVNASPQLEDQRFRIVHMEKKTNQIMTVYAEHVSYLSQDLALNPTVNYSGNAQSALNTWSSNIVDSHPFTTFSDISHSANGRWEIEDVENARRALGGVRGSLLDSYGGEYRFDNYHIQLWQDRGKDSGVLIAYGKNLVDLEQEEEIASTYTSVYPYAIVQDENGGDGTRITLPELFIDSEHVDKYARRKILVVDFSQDEVRTEEALRTRTKQYIEANNIGVPKVNIRVQFQDLAKTLDYEGLSLVEEINLCDTVDVYYEKLDIQTNAKIIKTVWNVLLDEYKELEIGEARSSLSQAVSNIVDGKVDEVDRRVNRVQIAANGKNRIFRGTDEPTQGMSLNDLWYKPVGSGETELYRWNGNIWELVVSSAVNTETNQRLDEAKSIAETARDNTHSLQLDADSILAGLGLDGITETNQVIVNQIKANVGDRIDHLVGTKVSEDSIQYQSLIERYDLYERVIGSTEEGVRDNVARIVMADNLFQTEIVDSLSNTSSTVTQLSNSWVLGIKSEDELVSAINASSSGVRIFGDNIILDGDTIVDGTFTVTDTIFADNMDISKFTVGTLNAANVNLINVNVDSLVGNRSEFVRSAWSSVDSTVWITAEGITSEERNHRSTLHAGELNFLHLSRNMRTRINGNGITGYKTGTSTDYERLLDFTDEGMRLQYISGAGTQANTSLILDGAGVGSFQYIDFNGGVSSGGFNRARIEHQGTIIRMLHPNNGRIVVMNRSRGDDSGVIESNAFTTSSSRDDVLAMVHNRIQTPRNSTRDMYLSPNGQGKVRVANVHHDYYPIRASDFENASSRELKTGIEPYRGKALDIINRLNVVEYFMKKDVREGHYNKYIGLISEDSPEVSSQDGKSIMSYAVDAYLIKAVQELTNKVRELESHVNN